MAPEFVEIVPTPTELAPNRSKSPLELMSGSRTKLAELGQAFGHKLRINVSGGPDVGRGVAWERVKGPERGSL